MNPANMNSTNPQKPVPESTPAPEKSNRDFYQGGENRKAGNVNHPSHYGGDTVYECIKVMKNWMSHTAFIGFCTGNAIKYICRWERKNGIEDIKKAIWYLQAAVEEMERKSSPPMSREELDQRVA